MSLELVTAIAEAEHALTTLSNALYELAEDVPVRERANHTRWLDETDVMLRRMGELRVWLGVESA